MNANENATFNQSNVEMSNPPTNITFTAEQLAEAGTYYYAYYDESYTVTWVGVMPSVITAPGYVEITEDQYNNGNLLGKVYDPETGNFNDPWIFSCCTYEVQYKQTEDNVQTILDDMQADITALQTSGTHTHDNKTVLDGITADKITAWDNAASSSGTAGADGEDGATFTPSVSEAGVLSWTNDKNLENPTPVNIKGADGTNGTNGTNGVTFTPSVSADGVLSWTNDGGLTNPESVNIKGADGTSGADIAAADILTKLKTVDGQNSGLDADTLDGLEASAFATTSQLAGKADSDHTHTGYASSTHSHSEYASSSHNHSGTYAPYSHSHSGYASSSHTHSNYLSTSGGTVSGDVNVTGVFRVSGNQGIFYSGSQMVFGTNNCPTRIAGSAISATKTITVDSDERLKENIEAVDTDKMIDFIKNIDVKTFNYIGDEEKCIGAIAQEVQTAQPEIAEMLIKEGKDGYLSIKVADLVFPLIAAVQRMSKEIEELKNRD